MAEWSDNSKTLGETRVSVRTTKRYLLLYCGQTSYAVIAKIGNSIISDEMKQHAYFRSPMKTPHLSLHTRHRQTVELAVLLDELEKRLVCKKPVNESFVMSNKCCSELLNEEIKPLLHHYRG